MEVEVERTVGVSVVLGKIGGSSKVGKTDPENVCGVLWLFPGLQITDGTSTHCGRLLGFCKYIQVTARGTQYTFTTLVCIHDTFLCMIPYTPCIA